MMHALLLAAVVTAGQPVELSYEGPLHEAIRRIADEGGLNVVVTTELAQPVKVHLKDLPASEALMSLSKVYGFTVEQEGALWVIRMPGAAGASGHLPSSALLPVAPRPPPAGMPAAVQSRGDLVSTGEPVVVEAGSTIDSAIGYGGPVILERGAVVTEDAVAFGADVVVGDGAVVEGDAVSFGGRIVKQGSGRVLGREVAMGGAALGKVISTRAVKHDDEALRAPSESSRVASFFASFALLFGLGFIFSVIAPQRMARLEASIREAPVKNGAIGVLALVGTLPATALLCISLIGIPVAMVLWVCIVVAVPLGLAMVANVVGAALPTGRLRRTRALILAVGALVTVAVAQIPVVGPAAYILASFVAVGAMLTTRLGQPLVGLPTPEPAWRERSGV
ncbi:MAG: hypothetical protein JNG84_09530 [Archangium sp.]|nr:hypothetical protein [Archangium sp.]